MLKHICCSLIIWSVLGLNVSFAQGESAVPFLIISPYAESNGMGESSVAVITSDPLAFITNPAHLGMQSRSTYMSVGHNYSNWLPGFRTAGLTYRSYAMTAGISLKDVIGVSENIGIGFGYSRIRLNLGKYVITNSTGPEPIGWYYPHDLSDQYTVGIGISHIIRASVGFTFKRIQSNISHASSMHGARARADAYDYGLLISVPVIDLYSVGREEPIRLTQVLRPYFDLNFGLAMNNMGNETVSYGGDIQSDPLPRYGRVGIGFDVGIRYERGSTALIPLALKWTREANDIMVHRPSMIGDAGWEYKGGLGDIGFFKEVILGMTNPETIMKTGWELNIFESIRVRGGRFVEAPDRGNRRFNTEGFTLQFRGIAKLLRANDGTDASDGVFGFILRHFDVRYNYSRVLPDDAHHPLKNTVFNSFNIIITN